VPAVPQRCHDRVEHDTPIVGSHLHGRGGLNQPSESLEAACADPPQGGCRVRRAVQRDAFDVAWRRDSKASLTLGRLPSAVCEREPL
jgi:hypothetical protein